MPVRVKIKRTEWDIFALLYVDEYLRIGIPDTHWYNDTTLRHMRRLYHHTERRGYNNKPVLGERVLGPLAYRVCLNMSQAGMAKARKKINTYLKSTKPIGTKERWEELSKFITYMMGKASPRSVPHLWIFVNSVMVADIGEEL